MGADHHVVRIGGAGVAARRDLQARIAPLAHHGQLQPDGRDGEVADVVPSVQLHLSHRLLRVQLGLQDQGVVLRLVLNGLGQGLLQLAQCLLGGLVRAGGVPLVVGQQHCRRQNQQGPQDHAYFADFLSHFVSSFLRRTRPQASSRAAPKTMMPPASTKGAVPLPPVEGSS